ncbi:glycosyltransferase family 4 protein [Tenacibaculum sp. IB213877]|uniref:glycosyltransferase family 4 protein n=1 Tax=Tenacibaculum sp. IB213877 TaxID=3097351 RepID=UPI002A5AFFD6|nr:glycosyltransferase family 4 protein [Tenacibaculum sp. IB213877]MDY0781248.1 glycosyltransferase family 4 protein [Tenacibaculum sp. IB213877]
MLEKPIVIHTHFHKRRTGVTRSIENILPYLSTSFNTYIYGYNVKGDRISTSQLLKLLFSDKKVTVHCHRNNEMLRMLFFRLLGAKFKMVSTRHAETFPSKLSLYLFKKSNVLVTLTQKMSDLIGINNVLIPHGVDTNLFIPKTDTSIPEPIQQKNYILCAGRVRKAKGQKVLLEASVSILKSNPDYALVIVGKIDKEDYLKELQNLVTENGISSQVYFIDETSNIISFYQSAKIVVVPSFSEGFSLVCAEAMSCGITTIATKEVGIHSSLINHKKTGYLFEAGNYQELSLILNDVISGKLPLLGNDARNEIIKNWSAKKEAELLEKVYKQ